MLRRMGWLKGFHTGVKNSHKEGALYYISLILQNQMTKNQKVKFIFKIIKEC